MLSPFKKHFELQHYPPELRAYLDKYPKVRKQDNENSKDYNQRMLEMLKRGLAIIDKKQTPDYSTPKVPKRQPAEKPISIEGSDRDPMWMKK